MKFDTVIIGGGLSGMVCGIRLLEAGKSCAIISQGQSALHFSSGSFDLLGAMPDGTETDDPVSGIAALARQCPKHPYSIIGKELCTEYAEQTPSLFLSAGINTQGSCRKNHYRITPMGKSKRTWLTMDGYLTSGHADSMPFSNVCIMNIDGFLDFYPEFIAEEFRKYGIKCTFGTFNSTAIEQIRKNPSEMRSANLARVFDHKANLEELAVKIKEASADSEAVILPAIIGINRNDSLEVLRAMAGKPVFLLPTLPPSIPGVMAQQSLQKHFRALGGEYFLGDTVLNEEFNGSRVDRIHTANHGNIPFEAENFVLATGSFFSKGLVATPDSIKEPIFGADTEYSGSRSEWYTLNFFDRHRYQAFGIRTDSNFNILKNGKTIENIFCCGAGLAGFHPIQDGCGAGVSILSAMYAADKIIGRN